MPKVGQRIDPNVLGRRLWREYLRVKDTVDEANASPEDVRKLVTAYFAYLDSLKRNNLHETHGGYVYE